MIQIDQELNVAGFTVYRDGEIRNKFYVLPNQPRFRLDASGAPVFKFIKYRVPIDKADGSKGGGFVTFDCEFVVPEESRKDVKKALDTLVTNEKIVKGGEALLADFTYTKGTSTLILLEKPGGPLVEGIQSAGTPSLYGANVSVFTAELSPVGATILEQALQGAGGVAQVIYDLHFEVKIPKLKAHVWFRADKFYSYWQKIDKTTSHWWSGGTDSLKDTRREQFTSSESGGVELDFNWTLPDADEDKKVKDKITDWAWDQLEDATKRLVLTDPTANTDVGLPDGVDHVTRDFSTDKSASFDRYFTESNAIEWHIAPQGTLPNITNMTGLDPAKYFVEIDADDPFFQTLNVNVGVNADFAKFGIDSIDTWIVYAGRSLDALPDGKGNKQVPHFTTGDQRAQFEQYIEQGSWEYTYGYSVQYKGSDKVYKVDNQASQAKVLTLSVGDLGLVSANVIAGGINWEQVQRAQVTLNYEDRSNKVDKLSAQFVLTKADQADKHWLKPIMVKKTQPITYSVTYTMAQGDEYTVGGQSTTSPDIYIDDPFYTRAVHVRALGDFARAWDTVFLDLAYTDATGKFAQKASPALSKAAPFFDWTFPVLTGSTGSVTFQGEVKRQNGTTFAIPPTTVMTDTIYINDPDAPTMFLDVNVVPDLIDWSATKLVTLSMSYDADNKISVALKSGTVVPTWHVAVADKTKQAFGWQATFYMTDGTKRSIPLQIQTDQTVVVDPSLAK